MFMVLHPDHRIQSFPYSSLVLCGIRIVGFHARRGPIIHSSPFAIKYQRGASRRLWMRLAGSLCHTTAGIATPRNSPRYQVENHGISIWDNSLVKIFHVYSDLYLYSFPYIWYPIKEMSKYSRISFFLSSKLFWEKFIQISYQIDLIKYEGDVDYTEIKKRANQRELLEQNQPQNIAMSATTFLTMALSTERFLAVCRPILYRSLGNTILQHSLNWYWYRLVHLSEIIMWSLTLIQSCHFFF